MACGAGDAGSQLAKQQAEQQRNTDTSVARINTAFQGFNPAFYQGIANAYQNATLPQLGRQFQQTQNQVGFKLANQGLGNSSQAQDLYNKLNLANNQGLQQVAGNAQQQSQQMQQQIGQQKAQLIGQAQTANNPTAINQQALSAASGFTAPSSFQPLGNMFGNFAQLYLGNQLANTYNPYTQALGYNQNPLGFSTGGSSFLPSTSY
jgi:hypothetical protein